jgi:hypothetical protein
MNEIVYKNISNKILNKNKLILKYERMIVKLWELLDDIDTSFDMFKPEMNNFEKCVNRKCQGRHNIIKTDGYKLLFGLLKKNDKQNIEINKLNNINCIYKDRIAANFITFCKLNKDVMKCKNCKDKQEVNTNMISISSKE